MSLTMHKPTMLTTASHETAGGAPVPTRHWTGQRFFKVPMLLEIASLAKTTLPSKSGQKAGFKACGGFVLSSLGLPQFCVYRLSALARPTHWKPYAQRRREISLRPGSGSDLLTQGGTEQIHMPPTRIIHAKARPMLSRQCSSFTRGSYTACTGCFVHSLPIRQRCADSAMKRGFCSSRMCCGQSALPMRMLCALRMHSNCAPLHMAVTCNTTSRGSMGP